MLDPWVGKIPWRRKWQPTPGYCPWGLKESDTTEQLHFYFSDCKVQEDDVEMAFCHLANADSAYCIVELVHFLNERQIIVFIKLCRRHANST